MRVGGHEPGDTQGIGPDRRALAHEPSTSSTALATRAVEPDSSSGLRRRRWRKADGATCRRCSIPHGLGPLIGGQRPSGAHQSQLAAQAVGAQGEAEPGRGLQGRIGDVEPGKARPGGGQALLQRPVGLGIAGAEPRGVALIGVAPAHHVDAGGQVRRGRHLHGEAEPVEELGPQLPLLRVAAAHQNEPRRVPGRSTPRAPRC